MWEKLGQIFDPQNLGIENENLHQYAQAPNVIVFEDKVRIYFTSRTPVDINGNYKSLPFFFEVTSFEPLKLSYIQTNPIQNLGDLGEFDEFGIYPFSVLQDKEKFVAIYGGWTRKSSVPFDVNLGLSISEDGKFFKKIGKGPILAGNSLEPFVITSPKIRKFNEIYYLFYTSGTQWFYDNGKPEIIYKIKMAKSYDLITWERNGSNLLSDKLGMGEAQASPDVIYDGSHYHMFFCFRKEIDFRDNPINSYKIGYASSVDLSDWKRDDSKVNLLPSKSGWDSDMVAYPTVFQYQSNTYMLYLGNGVGKSGIGLAKFVGKL